MFSHFFCYNHHVDVSEPITYFCRRTLLVGVENAYELQNSFPSDLATRAYSQH